MKLIHIGDLHLKPDARNAMRRKAFEEIVSAGLALDDLGAWLLPGDVNDGRMSIDDRNWLASILQEMANEAPVIGCYGNHDVAGDLDIFEELDTRYPIRFAIRPVLSAVTSATDESLRLFSLPYPHKGALVGVLQGRELGLDSLAGIVRDAAVKLTNDLKPGDVPLMIGHINVAGSIASTGQPQIGRELELSRDLLDLLPSTCYVALNHIHKSQKVGRAWYAGSVCRLNWGETEPKHALIVTYDDAGLPSGVTRLELDVPPMFHVDGIWQEDGVFLWEGVGEGATLSPGAEIRLRYRYPASQADRVYHSAIREYWETTAQPSRLVLEPIAMPDEGLRSEAVSKAQSVKEKVLAWALEAGHETVPAGVSEKLDQLLNPAGGSE